MAIKLFLLVAVLTVAATQAANPRFRAVSGTDKKVGWHKPCETKFIGTNCEERWAGHLLIAQEYGLGFSASDMTKFNSERGPAKTPEQHAALYACNDGGIVRKGKEKVNDLC